VDDLRGESCYTPSKGGDRRKGEPLTGRWAVVVNAQPHQSFGERALTSESEDGMFEAVAITLREDVDSEGLGAADTQAVNERCYTDARHRMPLRGWVSLWTP